MQVTVIDYGIGNLFSVARALEHCGAEVKVSADPAVIEAAPRLVLPGVGAFADGMQGLRERGLVETILRYAASSRPLLGICLGMQMLASVSEEFGEHAGLGLIPGRVVPVPSTTTQGRPFYRGQVAVRLVQACFCVAFCWSSRQCCCRCR